MEDKIPVINVDSPNTRTNSPTMTNSPNSPTTTPGTTQSEGSPFDYSVSNTIHTVIVPQPDVSEINDQTISSSSSIKYNVQLSDLLPKRIQPFTLDATDKLTEMLKNKIIMAFKLYYSCGDRNGGKVTVKLAACMESCNLSLPDSYAFKLKNDKLLIKSIIDSLIQNIDSIEYLTLPELNIETLHFLVFKKKSFSKLKKCRSPTMSSIVIPFSAESPSEIIKLLPQIVGMLYSQLQPCSIECKPTICDTSTTTNVSKIIDALKLKVEDSVTLIYDGINIYTGQSSGINRKRPLDLSADCAVLSTPNKISKTVKKTKKLKLDSIPKGVKALFTFDSFLSKGELDTDSPFTAYTYWQLDKVHNIAKGKNTRMAIIDSGIDPSHPAFARKRNEMIFKDFTGGAMNPDEIYHGTLCAGIACGHEFTYSNDQISEFKFPPGVAPEAALVICKVTLDQEKTAELGRVLEALQWIREISKTHHIDVVSISLGSLQFMPQIARKITELIFERVIVVCAASNLGYKYSQPICFPARLGHVMCIGSHGSHGKPSSFSPVGQQIDFLAPGENITGPSNAKHNHHLITDSGTSFATPAVAGLICLILGFIKNNSTDHIEQFNNHWAMKEILREISASPGRHSDDMGFGALNPFQFFRQPERVLNSILNEDLFPQSNAM